MLIKQLDKACVKIEFVKTPLENNPTGNFMRGILANFAAYERTTISERFRRGRRYRVEVKQQYLSSRPPFGYDYIRKNKSIDEPGHLEINATEAEVVKKIFHWSVDEGLSAREITRRLTQLAIPRKKGGSVWGKSMVTKILKCENYIGNFFYNRREGIETERKVQDNRYRHSTKNSSRERPRSEWLTIVSPHLRLIDDATFLAAQERLKQSRNFAKRNTKAQYLLGGGLMKCANCQSKYYGRATTTGKPLYSDSNKENRFPLPKTCKSPNILSKRIDPLVWDTIVRLLNDKKFLDTQFKKHRNLVDESRGEQSETLQILQRQVDNWKKEEAKLISGYQTGLLNDEQVREPLAKVRENKSRMQAQINELCSRQNIQEQSPTILGIETFGRLIKTGIKNLSFEEKQQIVRLLVHEVVFDGKKIVIRGFMPILRKEPQKRDIADITITF